MRKRVRELGIKIGTMKTGVTNKITDIAGIKIGHFTLKENLDNGECIRTGITAILPHERNLFLEKVPAASFVLNGFGKTSGLVQIDELGTMESPLMLTNTFNVGTVLQGTLKYMLNETPAIGDTTSSINIVVGECNDSYLNSARLTQLQEEHAIEAIKSAKIDFDEGAVGAGTGMMCFGYKGGIGSSSRVVQENNWTVGALVVSNFGRRGELSSARYVAPSHIENQVPDGSIMIVIATDAPLSDRQLKRLAKRATVGLARTGSHVHNGSGDIVIAFSTGYNLSHDSATSNEISSSTFVRDDAPVMNELFQGAAEATEEAIINSICKAETTTGRKGRVGEAVNYSVFNIKQ